MIENFEKLSHERKIDVLVAICIIRIKNIITNKIDLGENEGTYQCIYKVENNMDKYEYVPLYSTLLTSAWDVIKKFDYIYLFKSKDFKKGQWECKLQDDKGVLVVGNKSISAKYYAWAETEQLAICYAGLKAVGFDVKTFLQEEERNKHHDEIL